MTMPPLPEPDGEMWVSMDAHEPALLDVYLLRKVLAYGEACAAAAVAAERERWKAIAKSHMDMAMAMVAKEKARTAASILGEGDKP